MPVFSPFVGEAKMLSIGLFFTFAHVSETFRVAFIYVVTYTHKGFENKHNFLVADFTLQRCVGSLGTSCPVSQQLLAKHFLHGSLLIVLLMYNLQVPYAAAMMCVVSVFALPCVSFLFLATIFCIEHKVFELYQCMCS